MTMILEMPNGLLFIVYICINKEDLWLHKIVTELYCWWFRNGSVIIGNLIEWTNGLFIFDSIMFRAEFLANSQI